MTFRCALTVGAPHEGPIVLMLENHASELVWQLMRRNAHVQTGLRLAGFRA